LVEVTLLVEIDLLVEEETDKVELKLTTFEDDVVLVMLELDQIGGNDTTDEKVDVGVGFDVGMGSGVRVDEAPGPSPSQVML
jgi:hypothetical protein